MIQDVTIEVLPDEAGHLRAASNDQEILCRKACVLTANHPNTRGQVGDCRIRRKGPGGVATLTVPGRSTGRPRAVPVIPVEVDGASYLVSPSGESDWVRNLRKVGTGQLRRKAKTEVVRATELPVAQRPPIIAAYRKGARSDVDRYFTRLPDPGDHPVFRIMPASSQPQTREDG